jgi:hypothetical protein
MVLISQWGTKAFELIFNKQKIGQYSLFLRIGQHLRSFHLSISQLSANVLKVALNGVGAVRFCLVLLCCKRRRLILSIC